MDEHGACEIGQTAPMNVAGRTIGSPLAAVIAYLKEHPGTVSLYVSTEPPPVSGSSQPELGVT